MSYEEAPCDPGGSRSTYADYEPHANASGIIAAARKARHGLDAQCAGANDKPAPALSTAAFGHATFPKSVDHHTLHHAPDSTAMLERRLAGIARGAPWRFGETAIRAGSTLVFEGGCAENGRYE